MARRHRLVFWLALAAIIAALAALPAAARSIRQPTPSPRILTVRYGDSLWTLAREHADPRRDVREVVAAIMRENGVSPGDLQPGMTLRLPARLLAGAGE